jgi:hypothetical protein
MAAEEAKASAPSTDSETMDFFIVASPVKIAS